MDKVIVTFAESILLLFSLNNYLAMGADYRHLFAAAIGSLLATTRMKMTKTEKVINSLGGFSSASIMAPAICDYYKLDEMSRKGILVFFLSGFLSMLILSIIVDILNNTRGHIPEAVSTLSKALINKAKSIIGYTKTEEENESKDE